MMADRRVNIKSTGQSFLVPEEFADSVNNDPISLKQYAVQTNQLTFEQAFGREPEFKPEVSGPVEAGLVGAGRRLDQLRSNINQLAAGASGRISGALGNAGGQAAAQETIQREERNQQETERLAQPVREDFPVASFAGEALPSFAAPGGKVPQVLFGAAEGFLEGDSLEERLQNAALGSLFAFGGQRAGDAAAKKLKGFAGRLLNTQDAQARRALQEAGVPLTLSQQGSPVAKFFERARFVITQRQPLREKQIKSLNKLAAKAIGQDADNLGKPVLNKAHSEIGNVFEGVAQNVDQLKINQGTINRFSQLTKKINEEGFESPRVGKAFNKLKDRLEAQDLNGKNYLDFRSRLGKLSRQLWKKGEGLDAELVDDMIEVMDNALAGSVDQAQLNKLAKARAQWRFLKALRTGRAIDPEGNINTTSMDSAMRRIFPGFEVGKMPGGAAGRFGRALDADRQLIRPFRSSGTAENLLTAGALPALGVALGAAPGGLAGALLGGAATFAGGGAGPLLGGGISRTLARQLMQDESKR